MKLSNFLKDKIVYILVQISVTVFLCLMLTMFEMSVDAVVLFAAAMSLSTLCVLAWEYRRKKKYYSALYKSLEALPQKQYISQMLPQPDFVEAEILADILQETTKSVNDQIVERNAADEEYREYIETWIHEIKLPISCIGLICENNKNEMTESVSEELQRIEGYVEQALFYARSKNVEKDYSIRTLSLDDTVKSTIRKHSKQLIACKCAITLSDLDKTVYSDAKWLDFIFGQLLANSIKYKKEDFSLRIFATETKSTVFLHITDNGIGIPNKDIGRVFDKGFTGENGRRFAKSTGIGLYLCKRLCEKMHLGLELVSSVGEGTTVTISFPRDKHFYLDN